MAPLQVGDGRDTRITSRDVLPLVLKFRRGCTDGGIRCLCGEALDLHCLGRLAIARGSHVEPTKDGQWTADLSPVDGPVPGPFQSRSQALQSERDWLEQNWL